MALGKWKYLAFLFGNLLALPVIDLVAFLFRNISAHLIIDIMTLLLVGCATFLFVLGGALLVSDWMTFVLVPSVTLLLVTNRTFLFVDSLLGCPWNLLTVVLGNLTTFPLRWRVRRRTWRSVRLPSGFKEGADNYCHQSKLHVSWKNGGPSLSF